MKNRAYSSEIPKTELDIEYGGLDGRPRSISVGGKRDELMVLDHQNIYIDRRGSFSANEPRKGNICRRLVGIIIMLIAMLLFASMALLVKTLYDLKYSAYEQLFGRGFSYLIIGSILSKITNGSFFTLTKQELTFVKYRTLVILNITFVLTITMGYMAAATVVLLFNTAPLYTPVFSKIFLKEKYSLVNIIALIFSLLGLVFIVQPPFLFGESDSNSEDDASSVIFYVSILVILITAMVSSTLAVYYKKINVSVNSHIANVSYGPPCIMIAGFLGFVLEGRKPCYEWKGILLINLLSGIMFLATHLTYIAVKYEKPNILAVFRTTQVIFVYIGEIIFFSLKLGLYEIIGALIILIATISISLHKLITEPHS